MMEANSPQSQPPRASSGYPAASPPPYAGPQVVYVPATPSPFRRWFSWLGWFGFFMAVSALLGLSAKYQDYFDTTGGIEEKFHSGHEDSTEKVAIIEVSGVIGMGDSFVKKQIDRVRDDKNVKAVVVRVDSPGGTIAGSDYIYHHLLKLKKDRELPLVVSMGSIAASGGYYVSMVVGDVPNTIFAEPTTTTGSIGVIIPHYDVSGLLEKHQIKDDSIVSHPRKQLLSMTRPIRPEDRPVLEAYLADAFLRFKEVIKSGRPVFRDNEAKLAELATGEIFTANQAQQHGLVDQLGFVEDAVQRAAELGGLAPESFRVVNYTPPLTLIDALTAARAESRPSLDWQLLLEMTTPKAYYLASSLPSWIVLNAAR